MCFVLELFSGARGGDVLNDCAKLRGRCEFSLIPERMHCPLFHSLQITLVHEIKEKNVCGYTLFFTKKLELLDTKTQI